MKVAKFLGVIGGIAIEEMRDEAIGSDEIRISVKRCGICGSDISMTSGSQFDYPLDCVLGHETAGEVIEIGRGVASLRIGDKVAVLPNRYCGECRNCRAGRPLLCSHGKMVFGGFGERMIVPERCAFRMPDCMSFADGALVEPMACGRKALRVGGLRRGDSVLVLGGGNIGLSAIYWARRMGAGRIVLATRSPKRDDMALAMGADIAVRLQVPSMEPTAPEQDYMPDIVVECIGKSGMLRYAVDAVAVGGQVISLGMCFAAEPLVPAMNTFREVSIHFPLGYARDDFVATLRAFEGDRVRPEAMISTTIGLAELPDMISRMRGPHDELKVQVDPGR